MARDGQNCDPDALEEACRVSLLPEWRPSPFYKLLEREGPHALDAWAAAERPRSRPRRQPRSKDAAQIAEENERAVRRAFGDTWQFLLGSDAARELLAKLEIGAHRAFGGDAPQAQADAAEALLWLLSWDGEDLTTKVGKPPANELGVVGLGPSQRKVVHQLARVLGLHSESRTIDEIGGLGRSTGDDDKVLTLRPPRCSRGWEPPLSVARVLAVATA